MWFFPRLGALFDEVFLLLLGVVGWVSSWFVMEVVLLVRKDLFESLDGMGVDGFMIPVKGGLPVGVVAVVEAIRSFPCREGCISLPPLELWLIAWCLRCPGVAADVQDSDALPVLLCDVREKVGIWVPVRWQLPCFPNCAELDNHLGWCCGVFG